MKVLIIEDERFAYQSLYEAMRELYPEAIIEGPITTVKNMREALASAHDYDIIFSDIRLDDGLSFEALADVRLTTPIIFTTAYDEYALAAFRTGGIAYLLKPIDTDELTEAMQRAMKLRMVSRVSEIGDVWLDAGIVPYSTFGYFTDRKEWEKNFPAEWVTEMHEQ